MKRTVSGCCPQRRGTMLLHVIVYMTLASSVLMLSGTALHALMLVSDDSRSVVRDVAVLQRAARRLREDCRLASAVRTMEKDLVIDTASEEIRWTADGSVLSRRVFRADTPAAADDFRFRGGTGIAWERSGRHLLTLHITPPSPAWGPETPVVSDRPPWTAAFFVPEQLSPLSPDAPDSAGDAP